VFSVLPTIARYCVRVRVKLGSRMRGLRVAGSIANQMWLTLAGPQNRRCEVPTRDFNLRVDLPVPINGVDIHAGLTHGALTSIHKNGTEGRF
jgi:hypothetical protein